VLVFPRGLGGALAQLRLPRRRKEAEA